MPSDGRAFWERTASRYDLSMRVLGGPLEPMLPLVREEVDGLDHVLELAAGTGLVTEAMAPVVGHLVATDYADAMVEALDDRVRDLGFGNVRTCVLDVYDLGASERFDAIVAANVLHLLPDLDAAIDTMARALRPGGRLVVPTYCHDETTLARVTSGVMGLVGFPGRRRFTLDRLAGVLVGRGLTVRQTVLLPGLIPIGFVSAEVLS